MKSLKQFNLNIKQIKSALICALILYGIFPLNGQQSYYFSGAQSAGKSHASITDTNIWAIQNNPAAFAFSNGYAAGFSFANYYNLTDIRDIRSNIGYAQHKQAWGVSYAMWGNEFFQTNTTTLLFAKKISQTTACGIAFNYAWIYKEAAEYLQNVLYPELAIYGRIAKDVSYGMHIINPISNQKKNHIQSTYKIGASYKAIDNLSISTQITKHIFEKPQFQMGGEFTINQKLILQTGITNSYHPLALGIGYIHKNMHIHYASQLHSFLGFTHLISFSIFQI